ncbi:MAG: DsbA family oxidoreductase [Xanthomonadaceae bacterium]|nr:DsbA family oxidoreductase [Xanthomonadaceae bacterium]
MSQELIIDVYVDLICPWCLIGKRHLDQSLAELARTDPEVAVEVRWHSVQLLPDLPVEGRDFTDFYIQRKGSAEAVRQGQERVQQAALGAGAEVNFSIIARMPNTLLAHQLLAFSSTRQTPQQHVQLLERLLAAHFSRGEDLGKRATLLAIAQDFDLPMAELHQWLDSGMGKPMPLDVPGVPFFVFNHRFALSGAQPPELLLSGMRQALEAPHALPA